MMYERQYGTVFVGKNVRNREIEFEGIKSSVAYNVNAIFCETHILTHI